MSHERIEVVEFEKEIRDSLLECSDDVPVFKGDHSVFKGGSMAAIKFDAEKPPLSLISRTALLEEARVMAFGRDKYGTHNWRNGMDFSRLMDACLRHVYAFADGEDNDKETGLSHLAHARCCLAFLAEYQGKSIGTDDRFKR